MLYPNIDPDVSRQRTSITRDDALGRLTLMRGDGISVSCGLTVIRS
jgi:hypothetical protein